MRGVLLSIVLAAGCHQAEPPSGVECSALGECPAGMPCVEGFCTEPEEGGPGGPPGPMTIRIGRQRSQVQDTELWFDEPTVAHGRDDHLSVDEGELGLLRFVLPDHLRDFKLERAVLHLRTYDEADESGGSVLVYQVLESWDEHEATWERRTATEVWSTPGAGAASRAPTPMAELRPSQINTELTVELPLEVVRSWIEAPATNHGVALVRGDSIQHVHFKTTDTLVEPFVWSELWLDGVR